MIPLHVAMLMEAFQAGYRPEGWPDDGKSECPLPGLGKMRETGFIHSSSGESRGRLVVRIVLDG
jgi:hypothetical protein